MAEEPSTNGRGTDGRFQKGHPGGPGNPFSRQMARFRSAVMSSITDENLIDVTKAVLEKATRGDMKAAQLIYEITGVRVKHVEATIDDGSQKAFLSVEVERV